MVELVDVWGTSASDMWVVGKQGTLLHYDGAKVSGITGLWDEADPTHAKVLTFYSVRGSGAHDVWVGGLHAAELGDAGSGVLLLHYDGAKWSPAVAPKPSALNSLWAPQDHDLWLFGNGGPIGGRSYPGASHWDGSAWKEELSPTKFSIYGAHGFGFASDDVFATYGDAIVHWDGKAWAFHNTGIPHVTDPNALYYDLEMTGVWGANTDDLWAVGESSASYNVFRSKNGGDWTAVTDPAVNGWSWAGVVGLSNSDVLLVPAYKIPPVRFQASKLNAVPLVPNALMLAAWPAAPSSYLAVTDWTAAYPPNPAPTVRTIGADIGWPGYGVYPRYVGAAASDAIYGVFDDLSLRRLEGSSWVALDPKLELSASVRLPVTGSSSWFSARAADDVWITDAPRGHASHWDGKEWTASTICAGPSSRVASAPDGTAYAGCGSSLYVYANGSWTEAHAFDAPVTSVAAGSEHVWALAGAVFERTGQDWAAVPLANDAAADKLAFDDLVGIDASGVLWAIGTSPNGIHRRSLGALVADTWQLHGFSETAPGFVDSVQSASVRGGEIWAETDAQYSYRFNGKSFDRYSTGCELCSAISVAGPGEAWLSGPGALRYREAVR